MLRPFFCRGEKRKSGWQLESEIEETYASKKIYQQQKVGRREEIRREEEVGEQQTDADHAAQRR
jgi:hypothetical protein